MVDVFSWILSPEIREYLRGNYHPSLMEKQALIRSAYRPIEEKLSDLRELCDEAETEEDCAFLEKVVETYRLVVQEIRLCRRDEFYLCRTGLQFGGDCGLHDYPFNYLGEIQADIFCSYDDMVRFLGEGRSSFFCPVSCGYWVQKWRRKGDWRSVLSFDLKPIGEAYRTTKFYLDDALLKQAGLTWEEWERCPRAEELHPYPLPFSIGDLVRLDAPLFRRPVYGVLCGWTSVDSGFEGERFTLLGHIESECYRAMDLSGRDAAFDGSGYRVIDWLHSATPEELPAGQESLRGIAAHLQTLRGQDWQAAKDHFLRIFVHSRKEHHSPPPPAP